MAAAIPRGLKGDEIPLGARIFSVADTLDAITSDRVYRRARVTCGGAEGNPGMVGAPV